ncbi:MAG: isoleucine--tRNA ligase [Lachnospiraceae bacterium]|nr:isoleucine--tRNA ligase [Lachnospiraceae bacterium]
MLYNKVETNRNYVESEKKIGAFWKEKGTFQKSMEIREGQPTYTFYDGPPTANGKPHIGHVLTRVIKDMIPRYHTMKGEMVPRKAGWDTHGLPVELEVERSLGLDGKEQIEEYGMEPFIEHCKESVWKYKGMWEDFSQTVGFWADMDDPYVTYHDDFIESEWWALKEIWNKGLLYKGHKIVPYCPRCGTPLSSHEVAQGYKDVKERSAIARFQVKNAPEFLRADAAKGSAAGCADEVKGGEAGCADEVKGSAAGCAGSADAAQRIYILAWTTTPWTLASNVALCVNPRETYVMVRMKDAPEDSGKAAKEAGYIYILAQALCDTVLGEGTYEVLGSYVGKDLEYIEYEALYPAKLNKKGYYVVCDDYVTMSDGTGVVHIAPAFGEDDNKVGKKYDLPFLQLVDDRGMMTEETKWAGHSCVLRKDLENEPGVNMDVIKDLDERGLLYAAPKFEHSYPHCWRCDTPLIYYARESWFIRMTAVRDDLIRNNNTVNWIPESIGKGRFGDWLENVQDWGISRNRYWGTPLNIWECECGHMHSIGSKEELFRLWREWEATEEADDTADGKRAAFGRTDGDGAQGAGADGSSDCANSALPEERESHAMQNCPSDNGVAYVSDSLRESRQDIELHRPYIDAVKIRCPKCGKTMRRVPEVIDCWFDSGAMPFAQYHYPFENKDYFEAHFPAQFISEAVDQTRGWFYSLMAISTLLFNKAPFENVIVLGHVQDENGQKMSKSKGNAVDPFEALAQYGADSIRWYFYINSAPWLPNRFHGKAVMEGQRKFLGTLWNTYAFYVLYANIDNFNPMDYLADVSAAKSTDPVAADSANNADPAAVSAGDASEKAALYLKARYQELSVMDKWLLSKMYTMVKSVDENLGAYRIPEAGRALQDFVDDMSNWYVRRSRERFWAKGMEQDKIDAYMTLFTALINTCKAAAPMIPFITEEIYQNIVVNIDPSALESIHLCLFPEADEAMMDPELEKNMDEVLKVVVMGRACRNTANIKNRQPVAAMFVKAPKSVSAQTGTDSPENISGKNSAGAQPPAGQMPQYFVDIIRDELNVKQVYFTDDVSQFTSYTFKPQMRTVGPKYGKLLGKIRQILPELDGNQAMKELKANGTLKLEIDGTEVLLSEEDLLIDAAQAEGYVSENSGEFTVVLDTTLTPELVEEGFVRELISKIQTMRKEAGFEVMDKIRVSVTDNERLTDVMQKSEKEILSEVMAVEAVYGSSVGYSKEWSINGETATLGVEKIDA